jgi:hypothetical protein
MRFISRREKTHLPLAENQIGQQYSDDHARSHEEMCRDACLPLSIIFGIN